MDILTPSNVLFAIGIVSLLFTIYQYFRDPQVKSEKTDALLEQRLQFERESTQARFKEIQDSFQQLLLQSNNHIHTVDTKVETLTKNVGILSENIAVLSTIIEERIPRK